MNNSMYNNFLAYFSTGLIAFFAPILWAFWIVIGLVMLDTAFGIMKAGKDDIKNIKSRKLFSVITKSVAYILLVCLAQVVSFIEPQIPFVKLALFGVGFIEIKSIDENFNAIFGYSFIDKILQAFKFVKTIKRDTKD